MIDRGDPDFARSPEDKIMESAYLPAFDPLPHRQHWVSQYADSARLYSIEELMRILSRLAVVVLCLTNGASANV